MENIDLYLHSTLTRLLAPDESGTVRGAVAFPRSILSSLWGYLGVDGLEDLSRLPDVAVFGVQKTDKTLYYSVADIERISERAQLMPYGEYQIVLLDHAESMSITAANKLLKLFEDIPLRTFFIILTDEYDTLLSTIRSRVRYFAPQVDLLSDDHSDHIVARAIDAYLRGDLVVYYDLLVNGLKKVESPRDEYVALFDFLIQKYRSTPWIAAILLEAYRDIRETNLPLRGILDSVMAGLAHAPSLHHP